MTSAEQQRPTVVELRNAVRHIKDILFTRRVRRDEAGRVVEILDKTDVTFDDSSEEHHDVEKLRAEIEELHSLVYRDELTGALNRRGIKDEFGDLFDEARFSKEHGQLRKGVIIADFSIVFIDLDNFKKINDTYGHDEGDRVLKAVANVLNHHIRGIDAVGRLGGEEFVVALLGAGEDAAYAKAQEIRKAFSTEVVVNGDYPITASMGVASLHHSASQTLDELIEYADKAMYEAKTKRGKDNVVRYSELS